MLNKFIVFLFMAFPMLLIGQENSKDAQLIIETIENYFEGYVTSDLAKLSKAFDLENGMMKIISENDHGVEISTNKYFKKLIPEWAARAKRSQKEIDKCSLEILNLDIVGKKIGSAKINMIIGNITYVDILSLQKLNNTWKITCKIFIVKK